MFATLSGVGDKNCCPEALGKQCCVDAFVYDAVALVLLENAGDVKNSL